MRIFLLVALLATPAFGSDLDLTAPPDLVSRVQGTSVIERALQECERKYGSYRPRREAGYVVLKSEKDSHLVIPMERGVVVTKNGPATSIWRRGELTVCVTIGEATACY